MIYYFEIEIINIIINKSYKFVINNMDIKIQKGVLFITTGTNFQWQCIVIYIFGN